MDERAVHREKDGRSWRIGDNIDVAWIAQRTSTGVTIASAIPPVFDAYATVVVPDTHESRDAHVGLLLGLLSGYRGAQTWWLGYLDTGADDVIFPDAPMVTLYAEWRYVLIEAGSAQARSWRGDNSWKGAMPDLVFPTDRSWLLSALWDDDWRCLGGPADLVQRVVEEPRLDARTVRPDQDATPPGHTSR